MRIGFLHLGLPEGGITRVGRMTAQALRADHGVEVVERTARLETPGRRRATRELVAALGGLARCDAVVLPHSRNGLWAPERDGLAQVALAHGLLGRRAISDLHDVYVVPGAGRAERLADRLTRTRCRAIVVHAAADLELLRGAARPVHRIPLPEEERRLPRRSAARDELGVPDDALVLGMVGWIHERKNARLALDALALLPADAQLWLVGDAPPTERHHLAELREHAAALGVADRLTITGYVDEPTLDARLAALDVGLCPYTSASASSSIATLLAAGRPVVASDLPMSREQRADAPDAVVLLDALDAQELAGRAEALAADPPPDEAYAAARAARAPRAVAAAYLEVARQIA